MSVQQTAALLGVRVSAGWHRRLTTLQARTMTDWAQVRGAGRETGQRRNLQNAGNPGATNLLYRARLYLVRARTRRARREAPESYRSCWLKMKERLNQQTDHQQRDPLICI